MATMIPRILPDHRDTDIPWSERQIFEALRTGPYTKGWVVIHSVKVPGRRRNSNPREVDFLIMVPGAGAVCLEVKGDAYDVRDGRWFRKSSGPASEAEPAAPNEQAASAMDALKFHLQKQARGLKKRYEQSIRHMPLWYAVIFTAAGWPDDVAKPADCQVFDSTVANDPSLLCTMLSELIQSLPQRGRGRMGLTPNTIDFIRGELKPDFEMEDYAWTIAFNHSLKELIELTEKQAVVLRLARRNDRVLLEGGAGTGKTLLALQLAKERAATGEKVALLCHSNLLAEKLTEETRNLPTIICGSPFSFVEWLVGVSPVSRDRELYVRMNRSWETSRDSGNEFDALAARARYATQAVKKHPAQFDYLVMDELQNFVEPELFEILDRVLLGGLQHGRWAMFGDFSGQSVMISAAATDGINILDPRDALTAMGVATPTNDELQENCRNTGNIFLRMQQFDMPDTPYRMRVGASDGTEVRVRTFADGSALERLIDEEITRLHHAGIGPDQIVVLSNIVSTDPVSEDVIDRLLEDGRRYGPDRWQLRAGPRGRDIFNYYPAMAYCGLESDVVIMLALADRQANLQSRSEWESYRTEMYIGLSRPKGELIVFVDENLPTEVKQKLGVSG